MILNVVHEIDFNGVHFNYLSDFVYLDKIPIKKLVSIDIIWNPIYFMNFTGDI
jgi:hypothetical protein